MAWPVWHPQLTITQSIDRQPFCCRRPFALAVALLRKPWPISPRVSSPRSQHKRHLFRDAGCPTCVWQLPGHFAYPSHDPLALLILFIHTLSLSETISALQFPACCLLPSQLWFHACRHLVGLALQAQCLESCPIGIQSFSRVWRFCGPPGSSAHRIFQARILDCIAISFSRGSSPSGDQTHTSCVSCVRKWILYHQHHLGSPRHSINNFWINEPFWCQALMWNLINMFIKN